MTKPLTNDDLQQLANSIKRWARELGFQQAGIAVADPQEHSDHLRHWLNNNYHGEMAYMAERAPLRNDPALLHPDTLRVISLRMDYLPQRPRHAVLANNESAYISHYALGRDYHKLIRKRVATLAEKIRASAPLAKQRPFVDSAPVLERAFAAKSGLGWIGKNTMLINSDAGSWFFLAELFTDLPLPVDTAQTTKHCGSCTACLDICPTDAFAGPFELDARKCISYLTIELKGSIPIDLRAKIGNRVFGCDDCQLVCPWNKFAQPTDEKDFKPRHGLDQASLVELLLWTEDEFLHRTEGSPIRRIGYHRWLRNVAVGIGNGPPSKSAIAALIARKDHESPLVSEHIQWALDQLNDRR